MNRLSRDANALAPVLEYLFAFTVFILVLSLFFTALGTMFPNYKTESTHLEEKCLLLSEALMGNTGRIEGDTVPDGGTDRWETFSSDDLNQAPHLDLITIGLCVDNESYGVLSYDKIMALEMNIEYSTFIEVFALRNNEAVRVTVESTGSDMITAEFGAESTAASKDMVTVERFCVIQNNDARIMGKLTVKLFYGGAVV